MPDPRKRMARIRLAAAVWEQQSDRRSTDHAIGNLLRAIAQFPPSREPTAHERMIIDAALELADAVVAAEPLALTTPATPVELLLPPGHVVLPAPSHLMSAQRDHAASARVGER